MAAHSSKKVKTSQFKELQDAVLHGDLETIKLLVQEGADIHAQDNYALNTSADRGYLPIVKYLVEECGADIFRDNNIVMKWALGQGQLSVVKYLVEQGISIHANDDYALKTSVEEDQRDIVEYLLLQGADLKIAHSFVFENPALEKWLNSAGLAKKLEQAPARQRQ